MAIPSAENESVRAYQPREGLHEPFSLPSESASTGVPAREGGRGELEERQGTRTKRYYEEQQEHAHPQVHASPETETMGRTTFRSGYSSMGSCVAIASYIFSPVFILSRGK